MARRARHTPRESSASWPESPCIDPDAEVVRQLALRLAAAIGGRSLRSLRDLTGVDHVTLSAVLKGDRWPDAATIARLERGLDADLWPGRLPRPDSNRR